MLVALDYDDTYTADVVLWDSFVTDAKARGHQVRIVTMRVGTFDKVDERSIPDGVGIVYCNGEPKKQVMEDIGLEVDIWIDDKPEGIHMGSMFTETQLEEWRLKHVLD